MQFREWPLSWLSQQWVATAPIYILFVTTVSSAFPVLRLDIHICVLVVGITVGNMLLNLRLGLLRSWTSRCLFALHRYGSEVVRIQFCAIITLVNSALFVLWVSSAFLSFVPSLETLRPRFFGISREPQTSRSHVTSVLLSGLQFEVHVCTARSRSRSKWFTTRFFAL